MGDDLSLEERNAVRTAMQWNSARNAGFSAADEDQLPRPAIEKGEYGYSAVNVEDQDIDPDSLLTWFERAIRARKRCPEFGRGELQILEAGDERVFAHALSYQGVTVVAVHNLADRGVEVRVDTSAIEGDSLIDLLGAREQEPLAAELELELERYGFRWYRVARDDDVSRRKG